MKVFPDAKNNEQFEIEENLDNNTYEMSKKDTYNFQEIPTTSPIQTKDTYYPKISDNIEPIEQENSSSGTNIDGGLSGYAIVCLALCVIGSSFQVGWQIGVYNVPFNTIKGFFNQTYFDRNGKYMDEKTTWTSLWSLTNALNPAGGIIGGLVSGAVADYFGRKKSLLYINGFTLISVLLAVISKPVKSYETVIAGRFFAGVLSGLFLGVAPLYLNEIPPKNLRGITGVLNQLTLVIGILFTNIAGLPQLLGSVTRWPFLVGLAFIPMLVHIIGIPFCIDTPKYIFINQKNPEGARQALMRLRKNPNCIDQELNEMRAERDTQSSSVSYLDFIKNKFLLRAIVVTIVIHVTQQFSGINAVIFYSTQIFISIGLDENTWAVYATIFLGIVQVIMTFVTLVLIERAGRRILLLAGICGMSFFCFALAITRIYGNQVSWFKYLSAISVVFYIVFFSIGPGAIPWLITAELFNSDSRGKASSVAVFVNFLSNFIVTLTFPYLEEAIGNYSFIIFGVLLIGFGLFTFFKVPETKNRTVEEIWGSDENSKDKSVRF